MRMDEAHKFVDEGFIFCSISVLEFLNSSGCWVPLIVELLLLGSVFVLDFTRQSEIRNIDQLLDSLVVFEEEFSDSSLFKVEFRGCETPDFLLLDPGPLALFDEYSGGKFLVNVAQENWIFELHLQDVFIQFAEWKVHDIFNAEFGILS